MCLFSRGFPGVLLASLVILTGGQRTVNQHKETDIHELARQNKITQQILEYYLQRKLGGRHTFRPPSIADILPRAADGAGGGPDPPADGSLADDRDTDSDEHLQSVESEQVNSIYGQDCASCDDDSTLGVNRWTMPLLKLGEKRYYLGIFFKANWFRAAQYCRFHGMHLASISSQEENDKLEKYVRDSGFGNEHFWTSGTDLADEGSFFWMSSGRPLTFVNWNAGEPNNFRYDNGEEENCLELWNRDGKGLKWNDSPCSFETYFVCEVRTD